MRSTTPQIRGGWAAFWMMPYKNEVGQQGRDGTEIDIFETINGWNNKLNHALHWDGYAASQQSAKHHMTERTDIYDGGYHTFGLLWTATEYVFYVDGLETWRSSAGGVSQVKEYLKLTMEVSSGTWPGDWQDQVKKPIYWDIDYVRAYQISQ